MADPLSLLLQTRSPTEPGVGRLSLLVKVVGGFHLEVEGPFGAGGGRRARLRSVPLMVMLAQEPRVLASDLDGTPSAWAWCQSP